MLKITLIFQINQEINYFYIFEFFLFCISIVKVSTLFTDVFNLPKEQKIKYICMCRILIYSLCRLFFIG